MLRAEALDNGAQAMQRTQSVSPVLVQVIEGLVIMILLAFDATAWTVIGEALWLSAPSADEEQHSDSARSANEKAASVSNQD